MTPRDGILEYIMEHVDFVLAEYAKENRLAKLESRVCRCEGLLHAVEVCLKNLEIMLETKSDRAEMLEVIDFARAQMQAARRAARKARPAARKTRAK